MPEGPEIRRAADRVAAAIQGQVASDVFFAFERLRPFEELLRGRRVVEVTSRGKAMLTRFDGGLTVYTHNQLYGRWFVRKNGRMPKTRRQLRFAVTAGEQRALLYSASDVDVLDAKAEREHPFLSRLGPDVLSQAPTIGNLTARLEAAPFRRRQLASLLLDQGFVAGLGNYLRAEILFDAQIHPRRRAVDLDEEERRKLCERMIALTRRTYRTRGITLAPSLVKRLRAAGVPRRDYRFWVYGRAGLGCRVCSHPVSVESVGGRKCYWCPECQPDGDAGRKGSE